MTAEKALLLMSDIIKILVGAIKDIAAGGVLACAIGATVAGIFIFLPKVLKFIIEI